MARAGLPWIDSDMHLAEPGDLWDAYVAPELRDRVPELTGVTRDYNVLSRSTIPAIERIREGRTQLLAPYMSEERRCIDPAGQPRAMDREGIDVAILFSRPPAGAALPQILWDNSARLYNLA